VAFLGAGDAPALEGDGYARPGWFLDLGGSYAFHWFPSDFDGAVGARTKTHNSFGLNARAGYRFKSWLAAELQYEWIDGFDNEVNGSTIFKLSTHLLTLDAKFLYPGWGRFQPFALVGAGLAIYDVNDRAGLGAGLESSSVGFAGRVGAGLDTYLTENWVLRLGLDVVVDTNEIDNGLGPGDLSELFYIPIQLGVQYRF
jgi:opacity protein-like surface antigen